MYALNARADAPSRSTGTITLSCGMLNIPLSVFTGSEEVRVSRKEFFDLDPNRSLGRKVYDKSTGEDVDQSHVTKMAQAASGAWVELTDDEIAACASPKGVAEVVAFVPRDRLWEYLPEGIGQVRPQKISGKTNPANEGAFSLFLEGLLANNVCALIVLSLRGPARYALVTPTGDLIYVLTADQVRKPLPLEMKPVNPAHLEMMGKLIEATGIDAPVIINETALRVQEFVDAKAGGATAPAIVPVNPTDDLMAALEASIAARSAT